LILLPAQKHFISSLVIETQEEGMSKKLCRKEDGLKKKIKGRKPEYRCTKCGMKSPKEKWCCKAENIEQ